MATRYPARVLAEFATALFERIGVEPEKSRVMAEILLEGDLLGHTTHGLAFVPHYLGELERGAMAKSGEPEVVADFPAAITWDGRRLPGAWLTQRALDLAIQRAKTNGTCTVVIRRSHHIGCLAAYLKRVADQGLAILLTCSDPNNNAVTPHGGCTPVYTPNPIAAAWPTKGDPVMLDVSMSVATVGITNRLRAEGGKYPGRWAVDAQGAPTDDPNVLYANPPGALLPVGGIDHGHKGYALALLVEALTAGLAAHGRADPKEGWTSTTYLQVFSPALYGGEEGFRRETEHLAATCRAAKPRPGVERVRLPGEAGLRRRETQLREGVELYPGVMTAIAPWAQKLGVPML
jgi:L-lactate dehydrogenase